MRRDDMPTAVQGGVIERAVRRGADPVALLIATRSYAPCESPQAKYVCPYMLQVTLYIDDETDRKMRKAARVAGVSRSRWAAATIRKSLRNLVVSLGQ